MSGQGRSHQSTSSNWRQIVTTIFPHRTLTRTYCVPPVHFNRLPYVGDIVPGTSHSALVLTPPSGAAPVHNVPPVSQRPVPPSRYSLWTQESQPQAIPGRVQESDLRDDFAQNHVMINLQELGNSRHEAMFILSQIKFKNYLSQPAYAAAAALLPRPSQLDTKKTKYSHGEADFLMIHRQHGFLIGELKSVGKTQACAKNLQPPADADVAKKVNQAVEQLDMSETVVRHLVSDVAPGLTVRKTLFLPYVRCAQLQRVLDNDPQLEQAVRKSLGAANTAEAVQLCCCSDQLSQPASYWHVTPAVLSQLGTWWQHRMPYTPNTPNTQLTDDLYLDIVARFVGPATAMTVHTYNSTPVEVGTEGEAVAELAWRLALLVLTSQQLNLINQNLPRVFITGPPGTGKTVVLVLQGLRWLLQGHDVQVVSTRNSTRAVNRMITEQLDLSLRLDPTLSPRRGVVSYCQYNIYSDTCIENVVNKLLAHVKDGSLYILLDEVDFVISGGAGQLHKELVTQLTNKVPRLHLWAACVQHSDIPAELQHEQFTSPLRCAPAVLREIKSTLKNVPEQVANYSDSIAHSPSDGPSVIQLSHHGNAHTGQWPVDCIQCGKDIAAKLRHLEVGSRVKTAPDSRPPLRYSDVFILTRSSELHDDVRDNNGNVTSQASGVVIGLRAEDLPVGVLPQQDPNMDEDRWVRDVHDMAIAAQDCITVTHYGAVQGLERPVVVVLQGRTMCADDLRSDNDIEVVVVLQGRTMCADDLRSDNDIEVADRLDAYSRCTTQLIVVQNPASRRKSFVLDQKYVCVTLI